MRTLVLLVALSGCGALDYASRMDNYHKQLDPAVNKASTEDVAHDLGPPDRRETIGKSEFWTYFYDKGTTHRIVRIDDGFARGRSVHHYDKLVLEFIRDTLVVWQAEIH